MGLPLQNNAPEEIKQSVEVLNNLIGQQFVGKDQEILQVFAKEFDCSTSNELMEKLFEEILQELNPQEMNMSDIEELDLFDIAARIASRLDFKGSFELNGEEGEQFKRTALGFVKSTLHDVAFPLLALENPNYALSAKNMLKRSITSMEMSEQIDGKPISDAIDIENLPTAFSMELFKKLGGRIPGTQLANLTESTDTPDVHAPILHCELSSEQAVYLACSLETEYFAIKSWRRFYDLLKSNGKSYKDVVILEGQIGLVTAVIKVLYEKRTLTGERFLYQNRANGVFPFFQQFLADERPDNLFTRHLRKYIDENNLQKAKKIVGELFDVNRREHIVKRAYEIIKKEDKK